MLNLFQYLGSRFYQYKLLSYFYSALYQIFWL